MSFKITLPLPKWSFLQVKEIKDLDTIPITLVIVVDGFPTTSIAWFWENKSEAIK